MLKKFDEIIDERGTMAEELRTLTREDSVKSVCGPIKRQGEAGVWAPNGADPGQGSNTPPRDGMSDLLDPIRGPFYGPPVSPPWNGGARVVPSLPGRLGRS
jgi:hypothetical protein